MVEVNPILFLRFISPQEVIDDMQKGAFDNITLDSLTAGKVGVTLNSMVQEFYSSSSTENRFTIQTRDGTKLNIYSTNCGRNDVKLRCRFCGSDIPEGNLPVRIPVKYEKSQEIRRKINPKTRKMTLIKENVEYFKGVKVHCDFNCALGSFNTNPTGFPANTESYLRYLHSRTHPDSGHLNPADEPDLLDIHDGVLTYSEYKRERNESYKQLTGIIDTPARKCFVKF